MLHISYGNGAVDVQGETNIAIAVQKSIEKLQQPLSNVVKIAHQDRTWVGSELEIILCQIQIQVLIGVVRQYANSENWGGAFNRHKVKQVRWTAGGEGSELAQKALLLWSTESDAENMSV